MMVLFKKSALTGTTGRNPLYIWEDTIGVMNRKIPHSWRQDPNGGSIQPGGQNVVLFGFPKESNYTGLGVFDHFIKLKPKSNDATTSTVMQEEIKNTPTSPPEPTVYTGTVDETYIIRPQFTIGQEIVVYRNDRVLHSSPDIAWRTCAMKFL
jgi:hypothetical protein